MWPVASSGRALRVGSVYRKPSQSIDDHSSPVHPTTARIPTKTAVLFLLFGLLGYRFKSGLLHEHEEHNTIIVSRRCTMFVRLIELHRPRALPVSIHNIREEKKTSANNARAYRTGSISHLLVFPRRKRRIKSQCSEGGAHNNSGGFEVY
jgi:hypothetical protein